MKLSVHSLRTQPSFRVSLQVTACDAVGKCLGAGSAVDDILDNFVTFWDEGTRKLEQGLYIFAKNMMERQPAKKTAASAAPLIAKNKMLSSIYSSLSNLVKTCILFPVFQPFSTMNLQHFQEDYTHVTSLPGHCIDFEQFLLWQEIGNYQRTRVPRHVRPKKVLESYNAEQALGDVSHSLSQAHLFSL